MLSPKLLPRKCNSTKEVRLEKLLLGIEVRPLKFNFSTIKEGNPRKALKFTPFDPKLLLLKERIFKEGRPLNAESGRDVKPLPSRLR